MTLHEEDTYGLWNLISHEATYSHSYTDRFHASFLVFNFFLPYNEGLGVLLIISCF